MPKDTSSPFTPGLPVPPEFFVGRLGEINRLRKKVARSASGRLEVGFLIGERGIGKSSLASFVKLLSEREHGMLGLHTFLGGVDSLEEMV
ncbi:MAG: ATP-binding protein [Acidobacteria bacterium]|nr:ATP-binding protein [Acidobacteriota bacterium]